MSLTRTSLLLTLLCLAALPLAAQAQQKKETVRQEIERLNNSMMDAWKKNDGYAIAAHYSDDARIIGPDGRATEGREKVDNYWVVFPKQGQTWKLEVLEAGGSSRLLHLAQRSVRVAQPYHIRDTTLEDQRFLQHHAEPLGQDFGWV